MGQAVRKRIVVFCDFDGTITERDMILSMMEAFAPAGWETIKDEILDQRMSVQEGVGKMFSLIPSAKRDELVDYAIRTAKIRPGFGEFVRYCRETGITLLVTSGGIDFFVDPILQPYRVMERVYCNSADFSGETIRIVWPHPCDDLCDGGCGLCKPSIVRAYPADQYMRVVVGDSVTDVKAARLADWVIARSLLLQKCEEEGLPHESFRDFYDVIESLKRLQKALVAGQERPGAATAGSGQEGVSV